MPVDDYSCFQNFLGYQNWEAYAKQANQLILIKQSCIDSSYTTYGYMNYSYLLPDIFKKNLTPSEKKKNKKYNILSTKYAVGIVLHILHCGAVERMKIQVKTNVDLKPFPTLTSYVTLTSQ